MISGTVLLNRALKGIANGQVGRPTRQIAKWIDGGSLGIRRANVSIKAPPMMQAPQRRSIGLIVGATGTVLTYNGLRKMSGPSTIFNDAIATSVNSIQNQHNANVRTTQKVKSRFGGKLNYQELSLGSVTGLFIGVIAGKLSSVFVFLTLSSYLLMQFLQSRGIITIPWKRLVRVGSETIDVRQLVFEQPSFKISFVLTFLIAAYNI